MPVDTDVVNRWFDEYFATFEACARGERDMSELLGHYGVPLIFTSDAGVTTLMTDDEAAAMMQGLIDGLRANGYHHTDVLHPEVSVLNSVSALYRCALSRRKADGVEFDCPTVTFLVTDDIAGLRVVLIAVQTK
ncbi:MAG: hypothetical protein QOG14_5458 [Mycobacterium sp.]|jgi:hypothetical protein|nr:hypothetical protein [Mycobacterium sp.]